MRSPGLYSQLIECAPPACPLSPATDVPFASSTATWNEAVPPCGLPASPRAAKDSQKPIANRESKAMVEEDFKSSIVHPSLIRPLRSQKLVLEHRTQVRVSPARPKSNQIGTERTLWRLIPNPLPGTSTIHRRPRFPLAIVFRQFTAKT